MTRGNSYRPRQIDWLRTYAASFDTLEDLTDAYNRRYEADRTVGALKATLKREGIRRGRRRPKPKRRILSPEQHAFLEDAYTRHSLADCTSMINTWWGTSFSEDQIKSYTKRYKLLSGRTGRFEKGQRPVNAGTKGLTKRNRTSFKKGNLTGAAQHNYVPIGTERVSKDGYLERKVTDDHPVPARRWVGVHRLVWEEEHGPVPRGHVVVFLDGDKQNCKLDNLRCVPRGVLQRLNHRTNTLKAATLKGEARAAALAVAELDHRIGERAKG